MGDILTAVPNFVVQAGALAVLTIALVGSGWLIVFGLKLVRSISEGFTLAMKEHRDAYADIARAEREGFQKTAEEGRELFEQTLGQLRASFEEVTQQQRVDIQTARQNYFTEQQRLRDALVSSLERNTAATNMLTAAMIGRGLSTQPSPSPVTVNMPAQVPG